MTDAEISRMRERARQLRRIAGLAHDPAMVEMLLKMADEVENDADVLEGRLKNEQPGPKLDQ